MNQKILNDHGIDFDSGVSRCMNDVEFYEMLLSAFLEDDTFQRAREAFEKKDYQTLFQNTHELKGVSGNASMKELFTELSPLVDLVRTGSADDEKVAAQFARVEKAYATVCEGIRLASE